MKEFWFIPFMNIYVLHHKIWSEPTKIQVFQYMKTIGAAVMSECDGTYHPTVAGLLMFGNKSTIDQMCDGFLLDYREIEDGKNNSVYSEMCSSLEWAGNLFEFYLWTFERIRSNVLETCVELEDYPDYYVLLDWMIVVALTNYNYWSGDGLIIENRKKEIMIEGVLSIINGDSPTVVREKLNSYLPTKQIKEARQVSDDE